jgi:hypothetical protein
VPCCRIGVALNMTVIRRAVADMWGACDVERSS